MRKHTHSQSPESKTHQGSSGGGGQLSHRIIAGTTKHKKRKFGKKETSRGWIESEAGSEYKKFDLWVVVPVALVAGLAICAIFYGLRYQPNDAENAPPPPQIVAAPDLQHEPPVFSQPPQEIATAFVAANDPQQRLRWVRNVEQVKQHMPRYPKEALSQAVKELAPMGKVSTQGMTYARFIASFDNGHRRLLCVMQTADGPKVDWDAYARYGSASWGSLLDGSARSAEVRAFLQRDHYYSYDFRDDSLWRCYRLTSPDIDNYLLVYTLRESKAGQILASAVPRSSKKKKRFTLSISSENDGYKRRQFTIDRIHANGWVKADNDLEDVWKPSLLNSN